MGKTLNKKIIGMCAGVLIAVITWNLPLEGLGAEGRRCLALTLMTVTFWAFQVAHSGYIAGLYLMLLVVFNVAPPELVFSSWTGTTIYLIIGAYLIASAVKSSGLGERIAYWMLLRFVKGYRSIIISIFILTAVLSLLIPHPWPRAFLIMSVISVVIKSAEVCREDAVKIGLTVFASSVPVSLIFLTGDSTINPLAAQHSGLPLGWGGWFVVMGLPAIVASVLTCAMILFLFRPEGEVRFDRDVILKKQIEAGALKQKEIRVLIWLIIAILLWVTDVLHGFHIAWITLIIAMLMSFPVIGEVIVDRSWAEVPIQVLIFITGAVAIGRVGAVTGMNGWIAQTIMPGNLPQNIVLIAALITVISVALHMVLGSVIAVMGVAIPALISITEPAGLNPLVTSLIVYTAIASHYLLPFHHLNMLVGLGEENGMYTQRETLRLGIPLTAVVFLVVLCVELPWWRFLGLL